MSIKNIHVASSLIGSIALSTGVLLTKDTSDYSTPYGVMEVWFFLDSSSGSSSGSTTNNKKYVGLKINLEDLKNSRKVKYCEKDSTTSGSGTTTNNITCNSNEWKPVTGGYEKLAQIAQNYITLQHSLNIINAIKWSNAEDNSSSITNACKCTGDNKKCCIFCPLSKCTEAGKNGCCCPEGKTGDCCLDATKCAGLKDGLKAFSFYLLNVNGIYSGVYLSPVKAYLSAKYTDSNITSIQNVSSVSDVVGTMVYGFVDYHYRQANVSNLDESLKKDLNNTETSSTSGNKFFYNNPLYFSNGQKIEELQKSIKSKKEIVNSINSTNDDTSTDDCCCSDKKNGDNLKCQLRRNVVISETNLETNLETIQQRFKNCCPAKPK